MSPGELAGWDRLRHGGLLLDPPRLRQVAARHQPPRLQSFFEDDLRRRLTALPENAAETSEFVAFVLQKVCRFSAEGDAWQRGPQVGAEWGRGTVTGDTAKPRHLWRGPNGAALPVFIDTEPRVGLGRGRKVVSNALQWLRAGTERLALVTNGRQFRLVFAGLDFDAWCEWDVELWLEEGTLSPQLSALHTLLSPELWTPPEKGVNPPLVAAILDSRKGQADLSAVLGERVREAVELLVQAHGDVLKKCCATVDPADIYRAAVRIVMRMVVVLFAESRELLPRDQALYHRAYGLTGLLEDLDRVAARGRSRLGRSWNAWPRVLALFRLVHRGSHHPALAVPAYGGELFAQGDPASDEGLARALAVFESAAFDQELLSDREVHRILELITRTRVKVRQGRSVTWIPAPVDFSDLSTEYIGILYEGLLDFELKTAPAGDPVIFLAVGNQPALPLSRLEAMDDKALASLLEKMKDTSKAGDDVSDVGVDAAEDGGEDSGEDAGDEPREGADEAANEAAAGASNESSSDDSQIAGDDAEPPADAFVDDAGPEDARHTTRTRAETWARRAVEVGKLVRKPAGTLTPEKRARHAAEVARKARQLVVRVLLPGEWYLVRWGGTRKGSGTFYTRPGLAVPTVHRTLRPLCYEEPGTRNEERGKRNDERGTGNEGPRIPGSAGMAAGDAAGRRDLPGDGGTARTGEVQSPTAIETRGGVGAVEHCGRAQPAVDGRLPSSPADRSRFGRGDPDAAPVGPAAGDAERRGHREGAAVGRRVSSDASDARGEVEGAGVGDPRVSLGTLAPHSSFLVPKTPEEILSLKVCDPACGSGTFPVAALRFLTDALYASLHHHARFTETGDRTIVRLLGVESTATAGAGPESIGQELLPCRPDEALFEPRLKAVLRRHIVERCIYGVDLDPLAVELCRLALWIETMDRTLPFSFLDHKVKCGNSLVGAWFDQFQHYPVMAWKNREGGDKNHTNGVHYEKEARTRAIKAFVKDTLTPDLRRLLSGRSLFSEDLQQQAGTAHDEALAVLGRLHDLPVQDSAERARIYRDEVLGSPAYQSLKLAMDLWCACWFWPADDLARAPLPTTFASPPDETRAVAVRIAAANRFFHWELEFPDVFRGCSPPRSSFLVPHSYSGFDAILGNPPWENLQPNPEEFFSNVDPLFRTYGRLVKQAQQRDLFAATRDLERRWLDYSAEFNAFAHWVGHSADPFGQPELASNAGDSFGLGRGGYELHRRWREQRVRSVGFALPEHPFRYQTGRIFTYKLFLEHCHAILRNGGRLGQVIPSGIYSDSWSQPLRELFLERCQWEWLFGFENRDGIFEIHRSYKFNPVIIQKGGATDAIRTAFMRRKLEDWERGEEFATLYTRGQVEQFSPRSKAILEIQSGRDLEILEKIYANSVLLGDDGPDGWGIKYKLEFMMNTDAHLFPPRPWWEAQGYRPDEYSRWLKGDWRPIAEAWAELGVDPARVAPVDVELEEWLFDTSAGPEDRIAGARHVHGHLLKPGDVQRTQWRLRCAQPPYDTLPIPRAAIPVGIILSRDADAWIREDRIEDVALPLYQGIMIQPFMPAARGWIRGTGLTATWDHQEPATARWTPQYLMAASTAAERVAGLATCKIGYREVARSTDARSFIGAVLPQFPCGHKVPTLSVAGDATPETLSAAALLNSLAFDWLVRQRLGAAALAWYILKESGIPVRPGAENLAAQVARLNLVSPLFAPVWVQLRTASGRPAKAALAAAERTGSKVVLDALAAARFGLSTNELGHMLTACDLPPALMETVKNRLDPRGFWRVERDKHPECRHTVLTLVAFHDLEEKIRACGGDRDRGIEAFLNQNDGEGWMVPETLRLADYGLGHDDRAKEHQPVASRLGPRFYDWQLTQSPEESWRECHLHARNLLGDEQYQRLLGEIAAGTMTGPVSPAQPRAPSSRGKSSLPFD